MRTSDYDILVIGSGIAGLSFALHAAGRARVAIITKKARTDSNTNFAQGGIAAVMAKDDDFELHLRDTLVAGAGLCHTAAVRQVVLEGPQRVRELIEWGVQFSAANGNLSLGREGGHSRRRILHAADCTGREIERALLQALSQHPAVEIIEDHLAVDLLVDRSPPESYCWGALALDRRRNELVVFRARATLLAAGGLGYVYRHTTNPEIATGDGVAMAWRAGAELRNLEFMQFHPTALYPAHDQAVLISEAVRGEGAILRGMDGRPLMEGVHPAGSLATRDVVARTISKAIRERNQPHVLLDLSHLTEAAVRRRFPHIAAQCAARGVLLPKDPIPVVPAAHYSCGGVRTNDMGLTSIRRLFAAGEVACTGVHGANRLASNSLLEAVVFSHRAAEAALSFLKQPASGSDAELSGSLLGVRHGSDRASAEQLVALGEEVRDLMWNYVGVLRTRVDLERAVLRLAEIGRSVEEHYERAALSAETAEIRNLTQVAILIARCAFSREESRGLHYFEERPFRDNERFLRDTIIRRDLSAGGDNGCSAVLV